MARAASLVAAASVLACAAADSGLRGWNSWDNLLGNADEATMYTVGSFMQSYLLPHGYDVLTTDEGWYWVNGSDNGSSMDSYGRPTPIVAMYPSAANGQGFKAISDKLHSMGLKLGVWTIRGILKSAVDMKTPIFGTSYTADQAVRFDTPCSWNNKAWGCAHDPALGGCNAAAVAYYRSVAQWYAQQGIDVVKIDCMWSGDPSKPGVFDDDDVAFTAAFREVGITVSLSPGGYVSPQNGSWVARTRSAKQYRVTQDFWDNWSAPNTAYPSGLRAKFDVAVEFASLLDANGTFPDLDMLPLGYVNSMAHPPLTRSNLTADEAQTVISLWSAVGSPLIFGGRLPLNLSDPFDAATLSLLTNDEVLLMHNSSHARTPLTPVAGPSAQGYAWTSVPDTLPPGVAAAAYVTLLNGDDSAQTVNIDISGTALPAGGNYCARDLWTHAAVPGTFTTVFGANLRPHASGVFLLTTC